MEYVKLGDLGKIATGTTPSKSNEKFYDSDDIMFIKPDNLSVDTLALVNPDKNYISHDAMKKARIARKGSVLITCIGIIGKIGIVDVDKVAFNQQINAIEPDMNKVRTRYLAYALKYNRQKLEAIANAPVVPIINKTQFLEFKIAITPCIEMQQKIANTLDKAQQLIDKRKEQIQALDDLTQSVFYDMFGDVITNSIKLPTKSFGLLCDLKAGKFISASEIKNEYVDESYLCYGGNGIRGYVDNYSHDGEYPLIGRQGALCGNVQYAKGKFYATEHAVVATPKDKINIKWLVHTLKNLKLNRLATGAAQPGLTVTILNTLEIPNVELEIQHKFADIVQSIENQKLLIEKSLTELETNFNALMQQAFKGELHTL